MNSTVTISDLEQYVQNGLEALRNAPLNEEIRKALNLLAPEGYRAIAQFEEDGRKKRGTASAANWNPATGEIVLYFEPLTRPLETPKSTSAAAPLHETPAAKPASNAEQIEQCCRALAEAETAGRQFIALKWFRDIALLNAGFPWSNSPELRQQILTAAIEQDLIQTKKIPNPKSVLHPTTIVSLKRTAATASRFNPIPITGVSASETLVRDRGML